MMRMIDADDLDTEIVECSVADQAYLDGHHQPVMSMLAKVVYERVREKIKNAPTVDTEPERHGHWIIKDDWCTCSVCRESMHYSNGLNEKPSIINAMSMRVHYCPSCAAKMDERKEE